MVLQEAVACQLDPEKNKQKHLRRTQGKKTTIGTSQQKEIDILWAMHGDTGKVV